MRSREVDGSADPWRDTLEEPWRGGEPIGPGVMLGERYRVLNVAGRGGFGEVLVAYDERLRREVAIKVAADSGDVARLVREAEVTAHLDHPGIVAVHDVGHDPYGRPWYAMRVVRGKAFSGHIAATHDRAGRDRLLHVLAASAEAVGHAHRRGVAHGDLSPANIMVGEHGEVQVIDWGLAERLDVSAEHTHGRAAGTARYMSPERLLGGKPERASDVFALGMMLHELGDARREVLAIAEHATAREPARRYSDAAAFARDVTRFFEGKTVTAHDYRLADHLARLWRARRAVMVTGLGGLVTVVVIAVLSITALIAERDAAVVAREDARQRLGDNLRARALALAERGEGAEALTLAREAQAIHTTPEALGVIAAYEDATQSEFVEVTALPACARLGLDARARGLWCDEGGALAWWADAREALTRPPLRFSGHVRDVVMLAEHVLVTTMDDRLVVLGRADGRELPPLTTGHFFRRLHRGPDDATAIAWEAYYVDVIAPTASPAHRRVSLCDRDHPITALTCERDAHGALVCDAACEGGGLDETRFGESVAAPDGTARAPLPSLLDGGDIAALALRPGSLDLLVGYRRGGVRLVERASGRTRWHLASSDGVRAIVLSRDGRRAIVSDELGRQRLLSLASGDVLTPLPPGLAHHEMLLVDRDLVALGTTLTRWRSLERPNVFRAPLGISAIALTDDGALLARGDRQSVQIVEPQTGTTIRELELEGRMVKALAFRPGSHDLAIAVTEAPRVVVVNADSGQREATLASPFGPSALGFRRVGWLGPVLVAASYDGLLVTLASTTGAIASHILPQEVVDASFGRDVMVFVDHAGVVWRFDGVHPPVALARVDNASAIVIADDGSAPVVARDTQIVSLEGALIVDLGAPIGEFVATPSAAGRPPLWVAGLASGGVVVLDPAAPDKPLWKFAAHRDRVVALAMAAGAPDVLWSAGWDGVTRRYRIRPSATVLLEPPE